MTGCSALGELWL